MRKCPPLEDIKNLIYYYIYAFLLITVHIHHLKMRIKKGLQITRNPVSIIFISTVMV